MAFFARRCKGVSAGESRPTIASCPLSKNFVAPTLDKTIGAKTIGAKTIGAKTIKNLALRCLKSFLLAAICWCLAVMPPALASLNDDRFDGNIYALYGGNGSLVPPKVTLAEALKREDKAALLVFYLDDSSDCKQYATVVSHLQEYYGRAADFMPINVDAIPVKTTYAPSEPGYYYEGVVPQTVLLDQSGQTAFKGKGQVQFEEVDDAFREVYDLLPRSESLELKRRPVNELNTELVSGS